MAELRVGDQLVRFDRESTVNAYSQVAKGWADTCGCLGCQNFRLLRDRVYPEAFRSLLVTIGIDGSKESKAIHYGPVGERHSYGGRFYFVGEVLDAGGRLIEVGTDFKYFIGKSFPNPPALFGAKVAAVEFTTFLPWALETPWDPAFDAQLRKADEIMDRYANTLRALASTDR